MKKSDLRPLSDYPVRIVERLRFADTDRLGHVNNAVFATFYESGRTAFLYDPDAPVLPEGKQFVIARLTIDFIDELNWPGEIAVGTGVARLGTSSIGLAQALFVEDRCVSTAESVVVLIDEQTRRSSPLDQAIRHRLEALMLP